MEAEQLPLDLFFLYMRDGFIHYMNKTQNGQEYLENCWYLEQTEPDREKMRSRYGEGAG